MAGSQVNKQLPKATAKRLPQYYRLFKLLVDEQVTRTNSQLISQRRFVAIFHSLVSWDVEAMVMKHALYVISLENYSDKIKKRISHS